MDEFVGQGSRQIGRECHTSEPTAWRGQRYESAGRVTGESDAKYFTPQSDRLTLQRMDSTTLRPEDARLLLAEIERARRATRYRIGQYSWISFAIWATVFAGAAIVGPRLVLYWVVAVPVALALTAASDMLLSEARTARRADWRYWAIGAAI